MAIHPPAFYAKVAGICFVVRVLGVGKRRACVLCFSTWPLSFTFFSCFFSFLPTQAGGAMEAFMISTGFYDK